MSEILRYGQLTAKILHADAQIRGGGKNLHWSWVETVQLHPRTSIPAKQLRQEGPMDGAFAVALKRGKVFKGD